eukprot:3214723-Prymnesium_polylepis.1
MWLPSATLVTRGRMTIDDRPARDVSSSVEKGSVNWSKGLGCEGGARSCDGVRSSGDDAVRGMRYGCVGSVANGLPIKFASLVWLASDCIAILRAS